jgi:transporter family protein
VVILLIVWGIVFAAGEVHALASVPRNAWLLLILSAAATGLSWLFYFKGLQVGKASYIVPIDKSSAAMVLAVLILHEPRTWQPALGTLAIVAGLIILIL